MNNNRIRFLLLSILIVVLIWYFWPKSIPTNSSTSLASEVPSKSLTDSKANASSSGQPVAPTAEAAKAPEANKGLPKTQDVVNAFRQALSMPFSCWGKVVDENDNPVAGADVSWSANNNPDTYGSGSKGQTTSDSNGMFVVNSTGIGLHVEVAKAGYYRVPTVVGGKRGSYGGFRAGGRLGNTDTPMGTKEAPAVFVLRKMGQAAELLKKDGSSNILKNGTSVAIDLKNGRISSKGDITVACWVQDQGVDTTVYSVYDWRCVISVPGGGLIERLDAFEFTAPTEGYRQSDEIQMPKTAQKWRPQLSKEYFAKLADGTYARFQVRVITGSDNFIRFESYLNPTPGDRNLEFDPAKQINK